VASRSPPFRARSSTSPPTSPLDDLARACHQAGVCFGTTPAHVGAALARRRGSPVAANLDRITWGDVFEQPAQTLAELRALLA
jgi:hypothetical protein